jgi:hypothetical protein
LKERAFRKTVSEANLTTFDVTSKIKEVYHRLDEQQLNRGSLMHALADNIVVHQTNQQLNNRYDTNFYSSKVKELESAEI